MVFFLLWADGDPISGGAGWVGAGLLGLVLYWLCFHHLPAKDKQIKEMTESKDQALTGKDQQIRDLVASRDVLVQALQTAGLAASKEARSDFKESLSLIANHCREDMKTLVEGFKSEFAELSAAVKDLRQTMEDFRIVDRIGSVSKHDLP